MSYLSKSKEFDKLVNFEGLTSLKHNLAEFGDDKEKQASALQDLIEKGEDIGFPSNKWFSDHLPVGGILTINK